jgi:hypothetical protein
VFQPSLSFSILNELLSVPNLNSVGIGCPVVESITSLFKTFEEAAAGGGDAISKILNSIGGFKIRSN